MAIIWTGPNPYDTWKPTEQCFGQYATDELGQDVVPKAPTAARWCARGWLEHFGVDANTASGFNRWLMDHYEAQPIAVLNDINGWGPVDFAFAWDKYMIDLKARPDYYLFR